MRVKIWTVTTDGDNLPVETAVFGTEEAARQEVIGGLATFGVQRSKDGHKLSAASLGELADLWEAAADGCCQIEEHEVEIPDPS